MYNIWKLKLVVVSAQLSEAVGVCLLQGDGLVQVPEPTNILILQEYDLLLVFNLQSFLSMTMSKYLILKTNGGLQPQYCVVHSLQDCCIKVNMPLLISDSHVSK